MPRLASKSFAVDLLNSLTEQIAVLNSQGDIIAVNDSWKGFAQRNSCPDRRYYVGTNYLAVCEKALQIDSDGTAEAAYHGIRSLLFEGERSFLLEYPCHAPTEERWFNLQATRFEHQGQFYVVTFHENITAQKKTRMILAESHERFQHLTQSLPDTIYTFDLVRQQVDYFNRDSFLGYSRDELMVPGSIMGSVHPDDAPAVQAHWQQIREGVAPGNIELRIRAKSGTWEWVDSREIILSTNADGSPKEIMVILRLVTDRKDAHEQIAYHAKLLENVNDIIVGTDENFHIQYWNGAAERTFGWKAQEVMGQSVNEILRSEFLQGDYADSVQILNEAGTWKGEVIQFTKDNTPLVIDANVMTVRDRAGQITGYVAANRDITEKKQAQQKLAEAYQALESRNEELRQAMEREQQLARTDGLTGIYNHRHFMDIATFEFAMAERYQHPLSVLIFDVDKFKQVNDTLGHLFGDEVLKHVAHIAKARLRGTDVLARYGGEEFIVLLPNTNPQEAHVVAEAVRHSIAVSSLASKKGPIGVTVSVGITGRLEKADTLERLIHRADEALYQAKAAGRNRTRMWLTDAPDVKELARH